MVLWADGERWIPKSACEHYQKGVLKQPGLIPVEAQHSKVLLLVCFVELNLEVIAHIYVC